MWVAIMRPALASFADGAAGAFRLDLEFIALGAFSHPALLLLLRLDVVAPGDGAGMVQNFDALFAGAGAFW